MSLPEIGEEVLGKYRITRRLGAGGMGVVYAATHIELQETVAIKMLTPNLITQEEVVGRFMREARAAAKIKSDHAVRVIDVGKLPDGVPYMVMEFLEGEDLEQIIGKSRALPLSDAIGYITESAQALGEAHRLGIVHRDIKPANLFLATKSNGSRIVKVLDFGISKVTNDAMLNGTGATRTETVMGTPMYMSPEQLRSSRDVDARADVWSLGVVFYELLTGGYPFEGESLPVLYSAILGLPYKPIRERRPDLPPPIESIMAKCLEKDRDKRFASVDEFVQALAPFSHITGTVAPVVVGAPRTASGTWIQGATDATLFADVPKPASRRSGRTIVLVAVAGVVLVGGGLFAWSQVGGGADAAPDATAAGKGSGSSGPAVIPAGQVPATAETKPQTPQEATTGQPAASSIAAANTAPKTPGTTVKAGATTPLGTVKVGVPVGKPTGTNKVFEVGGRK